VANAIKKFLNSGPALWGLRIFACALLLFAVLLSFFGDRREKAYVDACVAAYAQAPTYTDTLKVDLFVPDSPGNVGSRGQLGGRGCGAWRRAGSFREGSSRGHLPAGPSGMAAGHPPLLFTLPDSGGYLLNGGRIEQDSLAVHLAAILGPRDPRGRRVFVRDNSKRPWADVERLVQEVERIGGMAYDPDVSGWSREIPAPDASEDSLRKAP
jgi:hypothetical protein